MKAAPFFSLAADAVKKKARVQTGAGLRFDQGEAYSDRTALQASIASSRRGCQSIRDETP